MRSETPERRGRPWTWCPEFNLPRRPEAPRASMIVVNPAEISLPWAIAISGATILCVLLVSVKKASGDGVKPRKIHSLETGIPIIGDLLEVLKHAEDRHDWMTAQSRRFNFEPWQINVPGNPSTIMAADPAVLEAIMTTHFDNFIKGKLHRAILHDVLGNGFINLDGEEWYHQRKMAAKFFSSKMLRLMMTQTMKRNMKQVFDALDARIGTGEFTNLSLLFHQFTLQTFMEVGVGVEFPVIGNEEALPFEVAMGASLPITARRRLLPPFVWRLERWFNIGPERRLKEALQIIRPKVHELVVESLSKNPEDDMHAEDEKIRSAVELFVEHSTADQAGLRPENLVDFVLTFMVAARDTSSLATSWFFHLMSKHPGVEAKIREEFAAKLPGLGVGPDDYITADHVKQLVYLEAVIKENLRFYPTATLVTRKCIKDTVIDGDLFVRRGQAVTVSIYVMSRNPKIWGPDAAEF